MSTQQTFGAVGTVLERQRADGGKPGAQQTAGNAQADIAAIPNGPAAAAILSAGIGCFFVGLFATLGDAFPKISHFFTFYHPTGALSGVTTSAIAIWLVSWYALSGLWRNKDVSFARINIAAFTLLALALLLTFPPFMDFLQGK